VVEKKAPLLSGNSGNLGVFHSTKNSGLHFRKFPVANGTHFPDSPEKKATLRGIPKFWKFLTGNFRPIWYSSWNFRLNGCHFGNLTIFAFSGNFLTKLPPFQSCGWIFGWMESAAVALTSGSFFSEIQTGIFSRIESAPRYSNGSSILNSSVDSIVAVLLSCLTRKERGMQKCT